ncbi:LPXTG cell wall anchor domain-containing protein [Corynebacterium pseudotuberculosis]|uniref:LPXTG cell wall anchor domain-containing protein n=1 Tax=Corynebacterium pseudotuberculosis TaxID=1719 RepID=UPI002FF93008
MSQNASTSHTPKATSQHLAGAFDIRNVIGALIGLYGLVLVICSFTLDPGVNPDTGVAKSSQDNLWSGLAMLLVGVIFFLWTRLRPIVIHKTKIDESVLPGGH